MLGWIVVAFCGLLIGLAVWLFIRAILRAVSGQRCESCENRREKDSNQTRKLD